MLTSTEYQNPTIKIGTLTIDLSTFTRTFDKKHYLPPANSSSDKQYPCSTYHKQDADLMRQLNLVFCGNEAAFMIYSEAYTHVYNWFVKLFEIILASDSDSLTKVKTEFNKYEQYTADPTKALKDSSNKLMDNLVAALKAKGLTGDSFMRFIYCLNDLQFADNTQSAFLSKSGYTSSSDTKSVAIIILTIITTEAKAFDTDTTTYTMLEALAYEYQQTILNPITATDLPIEIQYQYVDTFE